jgi:hypothetical protein
MQINPKPRLALQEETSNRLFFECRLVRSVWSILYMTTGFHPLHNVDHICLGCLEGLNKTLKSVFLRTQNGGLMLDSLVM